MVEGEELDAGVDRLGGNLGIAKAAGDDVCEAAQGALNLGDLAGIACDEFLVRGEPMRRHGQDMSDCGCRALCRRALRQCRLCRHD